ncbi:hypothetical protein Lfu02_15110 [Longispora fulva]|uniref:Uncharacterized protein n=1 Tax=Longispora fulva TaxID=619741 RepID=A0A8J7KMH1_9ACTN|nr:hypothetical protein [Longispora fulva]MBG6140479.1 hypothetical protein [Longispora fulva]GIG57139.1 hypothetical protein Lfu02_15110 [Longispora fulva]
MSKDEARMRNGTYAGLFYSTTDGAWMMDAGWLPEDVEPVALSEITDAADYNSAREWGTATLAETGRPAGFWMPECRNGQANPAPSFQWIEARA